MIELPETYLIKALVQPQSMLSLITKTTKGANVLSAGNVNKGIFDIHVIDVYLTNTRSSTWVFDTGSVAHICNSK
jgi:hypothetical protein